MEKELARLRLELERREQAINQDLAIAKRVQLSMIPQTTRHPKIDIDVRYVPLEAVGGDYCQVLFPDDACCYVTLCDVAGHGIGPALMATRVSSEVRRCVLEQFSPEEVVKQLNQFVIENFAATELFLTFFVARFDFLNSTLNFSGAGHPGPVLIRRGSKQVEVLHSQNIPIGIREDCLSQPASNLVKVASGDRLLLFTDGLTETMDANGKMLGVDGVGQLATAACVGDVLEMAACFLERLEAIRNGPPVDDLTLIIAEWK